MEEKQKTCSQTAEKSSKEVIYIKEDDGYEGQRPKIPSLCMLERKNFKT